MENAGFAQDALQLEALLLSRTYLYELFHKLFGGAPDDSLLDALLSDVTADVVDEFAGANGELAALGGFLAVLRADDRAQLLDRARDEYTRVFIGPGALPASPYESPYTGAHDMSLFQANTLAVREAYHSHGLAAKREQAVPDDHLSMMCAFMAALGKRALEALREGDYEALAANLRDQLAFSEGHLGEWLDVFAESVRNSKAGAAAVLYPQMLEGVSAFARADRTFMAEAAYWAEGQKKGSGSGPAPVLGKAYDALETLEALRPFGIQDNELVTAKLS